MAKQRFLHVRGQIERAGFASLHRIIAGYFDKVVRAYKVRSFDRLHT